MLHNASFSTSLQSNCIQFLEKSLENRSRVTMFLQIRTLSGNYIIRKKIMKSETQLTLVNNRKRLHLLSIKLKQKDFNKVTKRIINLRVSDIHTP